MAKFPVTLKARLLLFDRGHLLLLRQTKPNGGNHTLVGGTVEAGEFAKAALVRESFEEAGIILEEEDLELVHVLHKRGANEHRIVFYFRTDKWIGLAKSRERRKFKSADWFAVDALPKNLTKTVSQVLTCLKRGDTYSEIHK